MSYLECKKLNTNLLTIQDLRAAFHADTEWYAYRTNTGRIVVRNKMIQSKELAGNKFAYLGYCSAGSHSQALLAARSKFTPPTPTQSEAA